VFFGTEGLATNGLHSRGEAGENGVAADVGEGEGKGAAGQGEFVEAAEEEHGDHGAGVEQEVCEYHWESYVGNGF